jgi:hypothetical protein
VTACPLFIELCAGTAAVSLRLHRARARPPVSRMGAKTGYADVLLGLMGLAPGQGARDGTRYLWCEPDPGVRLLLEAYRDAELARAAADIIRGWAGEDPRALWERLRAEGPPRGLPADLCLRWLSYGQDPDRGFRATAGGTWPDRPPEVASVAARLDLPTLPAEVRPDAREVDPREVARWALLGEWAFRRGEPASGPAGDSRWADVPWRNFAGEVVGTRVGLTVEAMAGRWNLPTLPATIHPDARTLDPAPDLPAGTWTLIDPPYQGTTGYGHDLPRADVVALARRWAAAGALVMVCEQEPIPELLADGWGYRDIAHARKGQARTFSRQSREVVTMNRAPVHVPAEQVGLFGGAR